MKWLTLLFIVSCAQVSSLNMKRHDFGQYPKKIIWFQIAGLEEEHLAMLRFSLVNAEKKTAFEDMICLGKFWTFNLYNLRPKVDQSFWSQLSGKKDVTGQCSDYQHNPVWSFLKKSGFQVGVAEIESNLQNSIYNREQCLIKELPGYSTDIPLWISSPAFSSSDKSISFGDKIPLENGIYIDKSCKNKKCTTDAGRFIFRAYDELKNRSDKLFLLVRDFSYAEALRMRDFNRAQLILSEYDKMISAFNKDSQNSKNALVLVSSTHVKDIQFPIQGKMWEDFEQSGKYASVRESRLMGSVWANGARAENFCGIFEEAEIMERVLSGPKQQGLELKLINPFGN